MFKGSQDTVAKDLQCVMPAAEQETEMKQPMPEWTTGYVFLIPMCFESHQCIVFQLLPANVCISELEERYKPA